MMMTNNNEKSELDQENSYLSEREVDPMDHTYCSHRNNTANKVSKTATTYCQCSSVSLSVQPQPL